MTNPQDRIGPNLKVEVRGHSLQKKDPLQRLQKWGFGLVIILTFALLSPRFFHSEGRLSKHPLWLVASRWNLPSFTPSTVQSTDNSSWATLPFFYSMGSWPTHFEGQSIFYTVHYEKGPPSHFASQITAHWAHPNIQLILDGPRTPSGAPSRETLKHCLLSSVFALSPSCIQVRRSTLLRHIQEIEGLSPQTWALQWFEVQDPKIPPEDHAQGIYLSASSSGWAQDRFILINPVGMHQALILKRTQDEHGTLALSLLQKTLGTLKTYRELNSGRNWVNQELESIDLRKTHLSDSHFEKNPVALDELLRIQSLLIARISVFPQGLDSYFHLGGTSFLLVKSLNDRKDPLNLLALQNLESTFRYANDISAIDPKTRQIQALWQEGRKVNF